MSRHAVTGALGFSGRHIAVRLLERGDEVLNLTNHPDRPDPFAGRVPAFPLAFDDPAALTDSLRGIDTLFNTYWVRFAQRSVSHADALLPQAEQVLDERIEVRVREAASEAAGHRIGIPGHDVRTRIDDRGADGRSRPRSPADASRPPSRCG